MDKPSRARYTMEFKLEALRLIGAGQSVAATAAILDLPVKTVHSWLKAHREGRLGGKDTKAVTPEQMALAKCRAELAKTKMELDIVKMAAMYFINHST
jgi:transposase